MSMPFLPLAEPWFPAECAEAVRAQVAGGFVGPGPATRAFADAIAAWAGVPFCHLTTSGTVALTVAAHAVGLRPGDEILIPAYGVISTVNAFASAGLRPRLVDIDRVTGCIEPGALDAAATARTRAVCFVNFSGYTGENLMRVKSWCDRRNLPLIEDAACALGHRYKGQSAGSFGTVGTYSFSVPKVLTTGQGGAIVSEDRGVADRAAAYIDHGDLEWRRTNLNREIGTNLRFNDLSAALGLPQIQALATRLERRRAAHAALRERLGDNLYAVPGNQAPLHNIVFTTEPERLVAALRATGIGAVQQYRTVSQHPAYRSLADRPFPNADFWTDHAVYLPFGMAMTPADATRVGQAVLDSGVPLLPLAESRRGAEVS
jgi:perosamine synthetase